MAKRRVKKKTPRIRLVERVGKLDGALMSMDVLGTLPTRTHVVQKDDGHGHSKTYVVGKHMPSSSDEVMKKPLVRSVGGLETSQLALNTAIEDANTAYSVVKVGGMRRVSKEDAKPGEPSGDLLVTQIKSSIGMKPKTRGTMRALGLRGIGSSNTLPDRPEIRGLIARVPHLITINDSDDD